MNITITARKTSVRDSFKERIDRKLAKLDRFFDDSANAIVTVTNEGDRETVEVTIQSRGMFYRAEKTTSDRFDSLEAVVDSLFRQIVKNKNKLGKRLRDTAFDAANRRRWARSRSRRPRSMPSSASNGSRCARWTWRKRSSR